MVPGGEAGEEKARYLRPLSSVAGRDAMLVLLSLAAGCVDAASYLGLDQVFTANMTGNTVLLGIAVGQAKGQAALRSGVALAGFVTGVATGATIVERGREEVEWPSAVTVALTLEGIVLAAFAFGWYLLERPLGETVYYLIALSAIAMGVQSAAVRRLNVGGVSTTYVTGTLTSLTRRLIDRLHTGSPPATEDDRTRPVPSLRGLKLPAGVWLAYGVGAVAGGAAELRWQPAGILLPLTIVAVVLVNAAIRYQSR